MGYWTFPTSDMQLHTYQQTQLARFTSMYTSQDNLSRFHFIELIHQQLATCRGRHYSQLPVYLINLYVAVSFEQVKYTYPSCYLIQPMCTLITPLGYIYPHQIHSCSPFGNPVIISPTLLLVKYLIYQISSIITIKRFCVNGVSK